MGISIVLLIFFLINDKKVATATGNKYLTVLICRYVTGIQSTVTKIKAIPNIIERLDNKK